MTTIASFPCVHVYRDKEYSLSPSMIIALRKAYAKQKRREPFGPVDIKRSLYPLIERGLISLIQYEILGEKKATWYVTGKGLRIHYFLSKRKNRCRKN